MNTKILASVLTVSFVGAIGAGLAFAHQGQNLEPVAPCVGVISIDFGADGSVDEIDHVPVQRCGGSPSDHISLMGE